MFQSQSSLVEISQKTTPIADGVYNLRAKSDPGETDDQYTFKLLEGDIYDVRPSSENPPPFKVAFFGPVGGFYLVEMELKLDDETMFATLIARIESNRMRFADPSVYNLMAAIFFDALNLPPIDGHRQVSVLTDNSYLNWSLLQDLVIRYRDQIEFDYYLEPVSKG